ncbi:MAG: hypothetical protein FJ284_08540 [Planctomycetes bacterium]|nr:hypothetical protein [Planctomycetota bacterium]MBM4056727.1 hypothetical protein [Planctomycetota bacterium]
MRRRSVLSGMLVAAWLPARAWAQPPALRPTASQAVPPPGDGWRLAGEVVGLDKGNGLARNAIGAVAGFNPAVVAGKIVASNSGLADITQQRRMAGEISGAVADAVNARFAAATR